MTDHRAIAGVHERRAAIATTKLAGIASIHQAYEIPKARKQPARTVCNECHQPWPCTTTRILTATGGA